jgi:hypothetical protein
MQRQPPYSARAFCRLAGVLAVALMASAGCINDAHVISTGTDSTSPAHTDAGAAGGSSDSSANGLPLPPPGTCKAGDRCLGVHGDSVDKVDLLFVIDNSNSMSEEQQSLADQMPYMINALLTGDADQDGTPEFGPVRDLHLGVVSADMGTTGANSMQATCSTFGDDGLLLHTPHPAVMGCAPSYPMFLSFDASKDDPQGTANDFACIATLGTGGCGFEQPLEAALKALSPSIASMSGEMPITFLSDAMGQGGLGHGDVENNGFLRNDVSEGRSLVAVVVLTDEDDGSASDPKIFTAPSLLDPNDPLATQPLNLRDFFNPMKLYPVDRYVQGLRALRPGQTDRVVFGAIVGVPVDLVDAQAIAAADTDAAARDAFYQKVLADPRMKEMLAPGSMLPGSGDLTVSCDTSHGKAYPPRRIVETARGFGEESFLASICASDYKSAVSQLAEHVGKHVAPGCLDEAIERAASGQIACALRVILPASGKVTSCDALDASATRIGKTSPSDGGASRVICTLPQLAVHDQKLANDADTPQNGWYYDDFSAGAHSCADQGQRVAMANVAMPAGSQLFLDCP